ncbi:MAG TPA: O-antigen ligase family protein [Bryobacteraceae bacterium]|nr:O-antigen ligase family protein [Bryobacteraceae bacterium]
MSAAATSGYWGGFSPSRSQPESNLTERANSIYGGLAGLYAFCVPWSDMVLLPYQVQFSRPLAVLAMLCLLLSWRAGNTLRRTGFPVGAMALFILLIPIHLLSATDPERTGRRLLSYLGLFFMTLFIQQCVRSWSAHLLVLRRYIGGCAILLANLGWSVLSGNVQGDGRYTGYGFDPNDLAGQVALSIPVAAYLAFNLRRGAFWYWCYLPVAVLGILMTASRAGLVVLSFVSLYVIASLLRRARRSKWGLIGALLVTGWAIHAFAPHISFHRLATLSDEVSRGDMNGRGAVWINGLQLYWDNPVFGVGAGGFSGSVRGGSRIAAHNTYLEILVEHGAVGLALFLLIVSSLFFIVRRYPLEERLLWWVVLSAWMILILTLSWENREYTWLVWGLCASYVPPRLTWTGGRWRAA